jgi:potassium efflux system protein
MNFIHTIRALVRLAPLAAIACVLAFAPPAQAQDAELAPVRSRLETIRSVFDYLEKNITQNSSRADLTRLRDAIAPLNAELDKIVADLEPRFAELETRVKTLGPAPAKDAPAEDAAVAADRKRLGTAQAEVDGLLKHARVLIARGDQIVSRIDEQRRARLTDRLFERTLSLLDPRLWLGAMEAIPAQIANAQKVAAEWADAGMQYGRLYERMALAFVAILLVTLCIFFIQGWLRRRSSLGDLPPDSPRLPRLRRARAAMRDAVLDAAAPTLAGYAALEILQSFSLLVDSGTRAAYGLWTALTLFAVGRALARVLLRPTDPPRRLIELSNQTAANFYVYTIAGVAVAALGAALNILHRNFGAPRAVLLATSALMAALIAGIVVRALLKTQQIADESKEEPAPNWLRLVLWIVAIFITGALLTGHIWLASFVTSRLVHAAIVIATAYLLLSLVNAYFDEGLHASSHRGRQFASTLGIRTSGLELAAALLAGAARVIVCVVAIFLVIGNWGTSLTDLAASFDRSAFGIEFGRLRLSLYDIFMSIIALVAGIALARVLENWLANTVLPRTSLDPSLRNSIATIIGYAGIIAAISIALARMGLNLENIALVAGALSVGIGFGLQAIVSNFVSGLILLTERPVKVGDMVNVKGQEGYVRRISVRSTEVETFDRSSVIIPNSDFITGMVTNWTHKNKLARIIVKIGVAYDSDVDRVRAILLELAAAHPRVLKNPPPSVFFVSFGDSALNFELRCVIDSADFMLSTRSDLHFAILQAFRREKIQIPFPQSELRIVQQPDGGKGFTTDGDLDAAEPDKPAAPPRATSKR